MSYTAVLGFVLTDIAFYINLSSNSFEDYADIQTEVCRNTINYHFM